MKLHGTDWAFIVVVAGAGCAAIYAGLTRAMRRAVQERQHEFDRQLNAMATTVKALQARVAAMSRLEQEREAGVVSISAAAAVQGAAENQSESIQPQTVAALTAAATVFLGKTARVRSARPLPAAQERAGAWAQQGRVSVQTSHNPR
jgi:hypothetical protein